MRIFKVILINLILIIFLLETVSFLLINFTYLPNGLHTGAVLRADERFSVWHPKNFKAKLATKCWESNVQFNSLGLKQTEEIDIKTKKRVAILGDSMTENLQLSNDKDFRSKLQYLMPDYEIINFSVASTGLADQIEIYKNLIKKYEIDYLFLYITPNDIEDNFIDKYRPNRIAYKYDNEKIIKLEKNKEFFKNYNSKYNKFKRNELLELKKISNFYKIFVYFKYDLLPKLKHNKNKIKKVEDLDYSKNLKIYKFILKQAEKEIFNDIKTLIFFNLSNTKNYEKPLRAKIMIDLLNKYDFFYDPYNDSIEFMKNMNKYKFPFLGYECDAHYSEIGIEFLANYSYKVFKNEYKNH